MYSSFICWLHWLFTATHGLPLVMASGGYLLAVERGLLIAVASLIAEPGL